MEYEMWQNGSLTLFSLLLKYRKSGNIMENKLHILNILPCAILFLLFTCFCLLLTPTNPTDYWYTVLIPKKSHDVTEQDITIRQDVEVWTMKCELWFLSVLKASYSPDCLFLVEGQRMSGWWCSLLQSQGMRPFPKSLPSLSLQWPYINSKCALRYFLWHFAGQKKERKKILILQSRTQASHTTATVVEEQVKEIAQKHRWAKWQLWPLGHMGKSWVHLDWHKSLA